jgi:hypothetical protein
MVHLPAAVSLLLLEALLIADLRSELITHLAPLALFRVLLSVTDTVTSFPLSKHTGGGGAMPAFSGWCVFLRFMWEVPLPPFPVGLSSHSHFYKVSCSKVSGQVLPLLPSLAGLFIYSSVRDFPSPPLVLRAPLPLCYVSFFVVVVYYSVWFFSLFSLGGGQSVQGAMLIGLLLSSW